MRKALVIGVAAFVWSAAWSQPMTSLEKGETGKIVFRSFTPSARPSEMTQRGRDFPPAEVSGVLDLPAKAAGKVPAMILLHASGGVSDRNLRMWADKFLDLGIASFIVDSLGGRGLSSG